MALSIRGNDPPTVAQILRPYLERSESDSRPVVLMMCGIAGSGKTNLAKAVMKELPSFARQSIDEIIASRHGICGIDYELDKYNEYSEEADQVFMDVFRAHLADKAVDIVLDRSFYAKEDRDYFKTLIEASGARWVLVYFKLEPDILWRRICGRRKEEINANSALDISEELFKRYVDGFEHPDGEGEVIVENTA